MEIIKQTETFKLVDTTDAFEMSGNATREASGALNVYFSVNKVSGEAVGNCNYNKYAESETVQFGVNCPEENRDELTAYADTVIDYVLEYFKANN